MIMMIIVIRCTNNNNNNNYNNYNNSANLRYKGVLGRASGECLLAEGDPIPQSRRRLRPTP